MSNGSFHIRAGSSASTGGQRSGHPPPSPVSTTGIVGSYGAPLPSPLSSVAGPSQSPAVGTAPFPFSPSSAGGRPLSGSTGSGSDGGSVQIPTRKRYSSNFGHRYTGSGGVTPSGADTSGRSTPADGRVRFIFSFIFLSWVSDCVLVM